MTGFKRIAYEKQGFFPKKRGSSYLSVDKIQSLVPLRTSVFVSVSNEVQPYERVCMYFRICLLSLSVGQWRRKSEVDSIFEPQLQRGFKQFWKLYLNLRSIN